MRSRALDACSVESCVVPACARSRTARPYNFLEGTVNCATLTKPVLLIGREAINRAVSGDVVAVELLPESEWKAPADEVVEAESALKNDDPDEDEGSGDEAAAERRDVAEASATARRNALELQPTGRIVGVIKRGWRPYVCHLDRTTLGPAALDSLGPQNVFATPLDRKIPKIRLRTRQARQLAGQKFLVSIDRWDATSRYPDGHFVRALGQVEDKAAEIESLLLEWDVPYRPFSRAILDCLPVEGEKWVVPPKSDASPIWRGREDLRELIICSIDPPGCQDIDDALHARRLPNGNIEAGVHIADVSHFVHPDNPMDAEAADRGTTVYLVDKRIDMLPSLLGTNLCSLRPYVERLAFSVFWVRRTHIGVTDDAGIGRRRQHRQRALHQVGHRQQGRLHLPGRAGSQGRSDADGRADRGHPAPQLDRHQAPGQPHGRRRPQPRLAGDQDPPRLVRVVRSDRHRGQEAARDQQPRRGVHAPRQHQRRQPHLRALPADGRPSSSLRPSLDQLRRAQGRPRQAQGPHPRHVHVRRPRRLARRVRGSVDPRLQHARPDHGHPLHALRRVFRLGLGRARRVWSLRPRDAHVHGPWVLGRAR